MRSATTASTLHRPTRWHVDHARVLGQRAELQVAGDVTLLDLGLTRLRLVEATLSRLLPMSELNRLNHDADQWVAVSDELSYALGRAVHLHRATGGLFHPVLAPCAYESLDTVGLTLTVDHHAHLRHDARLDLSCIAGGIAADLAVDALVEAGAESVQVTVGRTVRVGGQHPDGGWHVRLAHPVTGRPLAEHVIVTGAVTNAVGPGAGSWSTSRDVRQIIDPRTGGPVITDVLGVIVTAPEAATAEAFARAAIIAGSEAAAELLRVACEAWIVTADGVTKLP